MSRLLFATLFSGSSGNAVYVACGEDAILIDAGKNNKCIELALSAIGEDPHKIRAVYVTHEHHDHISALQVFTKKYEVPVHLLRASAEVIDVLPHTAILHEGTFTDETGPFRVSAFYTPHDSACAVGYTVEAGGKKIGVATDMGMLTKNVVAELTSCDAALIESNYDPEMLRTGPYGPQLKARVGGKYGHLSNPDAALLAAVLAYSGTKDLLLGHLSAENNTPEKVMEAVEDEFTRRGVTANVKIAARDCPTVLLNED